MGQTINQVRHLYVGLKTTGVTMDSDDKYILDSEVTGAIVPLTANNGQENAPAKYLYFQYKSPAGLIRSDLIEISKIMRIKATPSEKMAKDLKRILITLDSNVSANPVAGQEYIIRVAFRQYIGFSEEDQYQKYAYATATSGMTTSDLYKALALSLFKNVKADKYNKLITVYLYDGSAATEITASTDETTLTGTYTGIIVEEVAQDWERGMMPQGVIPFDIQFRPITVDGDEYIWGVTTTQTAVNSIPNGHDIADLEYFAMGARGDMYRMMGYPNIIKTTYLVDPDEEYDTLDIHYAFTDSNESVQKSEKDITIVCANDGSHTLMDNLITALNTALGDTYEDIPLLNT